MSRISNEIVESWPTLMEIGSSIQYVDVTSNVRRSGAAGSGRSIVDDLTPEHFPATDEKTFWASPEQLASVKVPKLGTNRRGELTGFQRLHNNLDARKIAKGILDGNEIQPITVSIFPDGKAYITDGQHRSLGAIIARVPVRVDVRHRSVQEARDLFTNQRKARKIAMDQVIVIGDSALETYIQDAITSDNHPWSGIIGTGKAGHGTTHKISPTTAAAMIGQFAFNTFNLNTNQLIDRPAEDFNVERANQMARLASAFGNKQTNELAWRASVLRSITAAAVHIFLRNPAVRPGDERRWMTHMATFDFSKYPHLLTKSSGDLTQKLVEHWNKRLPEDRRVHITT